MSDFIHQYLKYNIDDSRISEGPEIPKNVDN